MTVDFMYRLMQYAVNKAQNGYLAPSEFNLVINQAQLSYANYLIGQSQQYQYGRNQSRVSFGNNENVRQSLTPIIYGYVLSINNQGFSPYPGDYQKMDSLIDIYGGPIRFISQDRRYAYLASTIDPIASNPGYELVYNGFQFYPQTLRKANLSYVKTPPNIVWAYTLDPITGEPTYDPAQSDDPVWFDVDCLEIIVRALKMVGVNLQAADVYRFADEIKNTGQ